LHPPGSLQLACPHHNLSVPLSTKAPDKLAELELLRRWQRPWEPGAAVIEGADHSFGV
jgi:hypothetical protein